MSQTQAQKNKNYSKYHYRLILISPYLQFTDRIKEHLINLNIQKRDIRIVYKDNKLSIPMIVYQYSVESVPV